MDNPICNQVAPWVIVCIAETAIRVDLMSWSRFIGIRTPYSL